MLSKLTGKKVLVYQKKLIIWITEKMPPASIALLKAARTSTYCHFFYAWLHLSQRT